QVGDAETTAEIPRGHHAVTGEDSHAEGKPVVVTGGPRRSVLSPRAFPLGHVDTDVGVSEMRERARMGRDELARERSDPVDPPGVDAVRHGGVASGPAERFDPDTLAGDYVTACLLHDDDAVGVRHRGQDAGALRPRGSDLPTVIAVAEDAALELAAAHLLPHGLEGNGMEARSEQLPAARDL